MTRTIFHVTHCDLDGLACGVLLKRQVEAINSIERCDKFKLITYMVGYHDVDEKIEWIIRDLYKEDDLLIVTDITPKKDENLKWIMVTNPHNSLVLDHHLIDKGELVKRISPDDTSVGYNVLIEPKSRMMLGDRARPQCATDMMYMLLHTAIYNILLHDRYNNANKVHQSLNISPITIFASQACNNTAPVNKFLARITSAWDTWAWIKYDNDPSRIEVALRLAAYVDKIVDNYLHTENRPADINLLIEELDIVSGICRTSLDDTMKREKICEMTPVAEVYHVLLKQMEEIYTDSVIECYMDKEIPHNISRNRHDFNDAYKCYYLESDIKVSSLFSYILYNGNKEIDIVISSDTKREGKKKFSLRTGKNGIQLNKIANMFDGGGHRNAAGFMEDASYANFYITTDDTSN